MIIALWINKWLTNKLTNTNIICCIKTRSGAWWWPSGTETCCWCIKEGCYTIHTIALDGHYNRCSNKWVLIHFFLMKSTEALIFPNLFLSKSYMFRAVPLPIIRSSPLYIRHWYVIKLAWHTSAECTVENTWWWAEELPETCSFLTKINLGKLVRLLILFKKKIC